jgi:hypothetical protein
MTTATVVAPIVLILVKCHIHGTPLGKVQSGAAYELRCRDCRDYSKGIAS